MMYFHAFLLVCSSNSILYSFLIYSACFRRWCSSLHAQSRKEKKCCSLTFGPTVCLESCISPVLLEEAPRLQDSDSCHAGSSIQIPAWGKLDKTSTAHLDCRAKVIHFLCQSIRENNKVSCTRPIHIEAETSERRSVLVFSRAIPSLSSTLGLSRFHPRLT
ncbi:hypothetical protein EV356DRAFT_303276 [Viridothelium virens]|uniref:Uncharacterized protein n=1 Tax=Viridothelium virens TaxID=1048519 RepID=A0A6A6HL76_VIRVR|nr:hypothetical protein EV356DRAFT_303276 [Viridothelium virens]